MFTLLHKISPCPPTSSLFPFPCHLISKFTFSSRQLLGPGQSTFYILSSLLPLSFQLQEIVTSLISIHIYAHRTFIHEKGTNADMKLDLFSVVNFSSQLVQPSSFQVMQVSPGNSLCPVFPVWYPPTAQTDAPLT